MAQQLLVKQTVRLIITVFVNFTFLLQPLGLKLTGFELSLDQFSLDIVLNFEATGGDLVLVDFVLKIYDLALQIFDLLLKFLHSYSL